MDGVWIEPLMAAVTMTLFIDLSCPLSEEETVLVKFPDEIVHHFRKGIGGLPTPLRSRLLLVEPEGADLPEKLHGAGVRVKRQAGARDPAADRLCQFFRRVGRGYAGNDID